MGESKSDVLQGTLDLMVLKTLQSMGPLRPLPFPDFASGGAAAHLAICDDARHCWSDCRTGRLPGANAFSQFPALWREAVGLRNDCRRGGGVAGLLRVCRLGASTTGCVHRSDADAESGIGSGRAGQKTW